MRPDLPGKNWRFPILPHTWAALDLDFDLEQDSCEEKEREHLGRVVRTECGMVVEDTVLSDGSTRSHFRQSVQER